MINSIGIIGCGWLGLALAKVLKKNNLAVLSTVRSADKRDKLQAQGIDSVLFDTAQRYDETHAIFQQDAICIAITPGFKRGRTDYPDNVAKIVQTAELSGVKKILLISSTGIYAGLSGQVDENTEIVFDQRQPQSKVQQLLLAEQAVLKFSLSGKILRLSGLVGEDRLPGKFLAGKTELPGANNTLNLIHQQDAVGLCVTILLNEIEQKIFTGVSHTTATKAVFYQQAARLMSLPTPTFATTTHQVKSHQVLGEQTRTWLNYQYQYDDLYHWLNNVC